MSEHTSQPSTEKYVASTLLPAIMAGLLNGSLIVIFQSAYATLIFSGNLSSFLSQGIGIMLFGATVMGLTMALFSSFKGTVTAPQDAPSAIFAVVAGTIAGAMTINTPGQSSPFITVVAAIAFTSLFTGLTLTAMGWFRMGNLIRFIPYPVIGGFLAGTGWILFKGALGIMAEIPVSFPSLTTLFSSTMLLKWFPGLVFGLLLFIVQKRIRHFLILPLLILSGIGLFYLILYFSGTSISMAREQGFLLTQISGGVHWSPILYTSFHEIDWNSILRQSGTLGTITIISIISLLLNASGLELIARQEIDLNREMRITGLANLLSGLGNSSVGYMSLSLTALAYRIGSRSRISSVVSAGICGVVLISNATISSYFPRPLLGGLLIFLGFSFLYDWIYLAWFRLPRSEYFLVMIILITIGVFNFLEGIIIGMLIAVILFAVNYSRINVIKNQLTGETYQSNVDRAAPLQQFLKTQGQRTLILKLQGYIFFGTANTVLELVKQRVQNSQLQPLQYLVLDFRLVTGLDSSALHSFEKMKLLAETYGVTLVFVSLTPKLEHQFQIGGILDSREKVSIHTFMDLDHGMEWIENQLLTEASSDESLWQENQSPQEFLSSIFQFSLAVSGDKPPSLQTIQRVTDYFEECEFKKGDYLIQQGAPPRGIHIIRHGKVTVMLEDPPHPPVRLRTMSRGTVIGELGVYLKIPATASVIAEEPCSTLFISPEQLMKMEQNHPKAANAFHKFIIHILGERLSNSNRMVHELLK
ncbi:MAG: STAS domain-containing protein [Calditrichaeota bacterium]|nr:MAG: STAS domain-containing protein [Calditrichota bacterium]